MLHTLINQTIISSDGKNFLWDKWERGRMFARTGGDADKPRWECMGMVITDRWRCRQISAGMNGDGDESARAGRDGNNFLSPDSFRLTAATHK